MNEHDDFEVSTFARTWQIDTLDITDRVATRIDPQPTAEILMEQVLGELRSLRSEIATFRAENHALRSEIGRLRTDLASRTVARISPFSPSETFARTSGN